MKISQIRIRNLRSCKDAVIPLDDYTCFVGPNGAGKSTILFALNLFFRDLSVGSSNGLSPEDFHHKDTSEPIEIELTFKGLSQAAKEDFAEYYRQDQLVVSAIAEYNEGSNRAEIKQYGKRLVLPKFAPFFEALSAGDKVERLKQIYAELRKEFGELPDTKTKDSMATALKDFENTKKELCELVPSEDQFYGFSKGANRLQKYVQWVYVPAVKDATTEQSEVRNSALSQLLMRTVRAQINFKERVDQLRKQARDSYQQMLTDNQTALQGISDALKDKLMKWSHPDANLVIRWHEEPDKSIRIDEPIAKVVAGEGLFEGELSRFGHGFQRSYLLALLEVLATLDDSESPTLLLGCEEPELYQHPPQARHLSTVLQDLSANNSQVLVSSHSPLFVNGQRFEQIRVVRKNKDGGSMIAFATTEEFAAQYARARGEQPEKITGVLMKIHQTLQPHINEMFFCPRLVLVEGLEDVAHITTYLHLMGLWHRYRQTGCHILASNSKHHIVTPLIIAQMMNIPVFVVCDADSDARADNLPKHEKDNRALLRRSGLEDQQPFPDTTVWAPNIVMWPTNITSLIESEIEGWVNHKNSVQAKAGHAGGLQKNSLFIADCLTAAWESGHKSESLQRLCSKILEFASETKVTCETKDVVEASSR